MRWTAVLLMIYLSALLVFPCCAVDDCPDDKPITEQFGHSSGDEDDCGTCSPFFNCESCATVSIQTDAVQISIPEIDYPSVYAGFIQRDISEPHYDFWRPPQLS